MSCQSKVVTCTYPWTSHMAHVGWGTMTALGIVCGARLAPAQVPTAQVLHLYFIPECPTHHCSIQQFIQLVCLTTPPRYENACQFCTSACRAPHCIVDSDKASAAGQAVIGVCATFAHDCVRTNGKAYIRGCLQLSAFRTSRCQLTSTCDLHRS